MVGKREHSYVADVPELMKFYHEEENKKRFGKDATQMTSSAAKRALFACKKCGHHWFTHLYNAKKEAVKGNFHCTCCSGRVKTPVTFEEAVAKEEERFGPETDKQKQPRDYSAITKAGRIRRSLDPSFERRDFKVVKTEAPELISKDIVLTCPDCGFEWKPDTYYRKHSTALVCPKCADDTDRKVREQKFHCGLIDSVVKNPRGMKATEDTSVNTKPDTVTEDSKSEEDSNSVDTKPDTVTEDSKSEEDSGSIGSKVVEDIMNWAIARQKVKSDNSSEKTEVCSEAKIEVSNTAVDACTSTATVVKNIDLKETEDKKVVKPKNSFIIPRPEEKTQQEMQQFNPVSMRKLIPNKPLYEIAKKFLKDIRIGFRVVLSQHTGDVSNFIHKFLTDRCDEVVRTIDGDKMTFKSTFPTVTVRKYKQTDSAIVIDSTMDYTDILMAKRLLSEILKLSNRKDYSLIQVKFVLPHKSSLFIERLIMLAYLTEDMNFAITEAKGKSPLLNIGFITDMVESWNTKKDEDALLSVIKEEWMFSYQKYFINLNDMIARGGNSIVVYMGTKLLNLEHYINYFLFMFVKAYTLELEAHEFPFNDVKHLKGVQIAKWLVKDMEDFAFGYEGLYNCFNRVIPAFESARDVNIMHEKHLRFDEKRPYDMPF